MMTQANDQGTPELTQDIQEKIKKWSQEEFVKMQKFCLSKGIKFQGFKLDKSRCIPPSIGIWYINSDVKGEDFWAIGGQFPTDIAPANVAKDAREVTRHFALSWQLKAARMEDSIAEGKVQLGDKATQEKFIKELIEKAELLYKIHGDENLWAKQELQNAS